MARLTLSGIHVTYRLFDAGQRSFTRSLFPAGDNDHRLEIQALTEIDLCLEPGAQVALLGPNSSGKTTLLRVMAGLLPPRRGSMTVEGRPGAVFSMGFGIDPEASLGDLAYAEGLLRGLPRAQARAMAATILDFADLTDQAGTYAHVAPPGILSRLGIAATLCLGADIILLDEVLELVDPIFHDRLHTALSERTRAGGIVVMVERSRDLLARFCTEAIVLRDGRITTRAPLPDALSAAGASQTF